jgi:hypothetical protein
MVGKDGMQGEIPMNRMETPEPAESEASPTPSIGARETFLGDLASGDLYRLLRPGRGSRWPSRGSKPPAAGHQ